MNTRVDLNPEKRNQSDHASNRNLDSPIVPRARFYCNYWDTKVHGITSLKSLVAFHFTVS